MQGARNYDVGSGDWSSATPSNPTQLKIKRCTFSSSFLSLLVTLVTVSPEFIAWRVIVFMI